MNPRAKLSIVLVLITIFTFFVLFGLRQQAFEMYRDLKRFVIPKTLEQKEGLLSVFLSGSREFKQLPVLKLKVPENSAYQGADAGSPYQISNFRFISKRPLAISNIYIYWGAEWSAEAPYFDKELASRLWLDETVLIVSWNPSKPVSENPINQPEYRLKKIYEGDYDKYIDRWVRDIKEWRLPVVLRFGPEMNGDWVPWGTRYNKPHQYKIAYRYVFNKFEKAGVKNISWMWSPNEAGFENLNDWYPGDKYVDWIGLSGFNWGVKGLGQSKRWRSFAEIYGKSFEQLKNKNKPISLTEFSSIEDKNNPRRKAEWVTDSYKTIRLDYPNVKMIIWTNIVSHNIDWRVDSSDAALKAFQKAINNPYFLDKALVGTP